MNTDFILGKAVEYFNQWDSSRRTVAENQLLFVKLRWVNYSYDGNYEDLTGFHDGDISGEFDAEQLKQQVICLWIGGAGSNLTATADDFVVISAEEYNVGTGIPVFALPDQDGWTSESPAHIWDDLSGQENFDATKVTFVAGVNTNADEPRDDMWIVNPLKDDSLTAGEYQLQRLRPLLQTVERTFHFTLDGSNSSGEETYGDFYALIPAVMDSTVDMHIYVNPTTAMPANSPTGWFPLYLRGEANTDAVTPVIQIMTSDPSQAYMSMNNSGVAAENVRPSPGWYRFNINSPIPEGFFAELTIVMTYKQRFLGSDRLAYYISS